MDIPENQNIKTEEDALLEWVLVLNKFSSLD